MRIIHDFVLTSVLITCSACVSEHDQEPTGNEVSGAPIRSAEELGTYLQTTPKSPLNYLPPGARQHFLDGLVFSDSGLGSFRYTELESLPATKIYQILSLFGAERTTSMVTKDRVGSVSDGGSLQRAPSGNDHEGYYCASRATCVVATGAICMSSC